MLPRYVAQLLEEGDGGGIVFSVHTGEEVSGAVGKEGDVLGPPLPHVPLCALHQSGADAFPAEGFLHEQSHDPASVRLQAPLHIGELPAHTQAEAHNLVPFQGHIAQLRVEIVVKQRLGPEFLDGDGVRGHGLIPQVHHLGLIFLQIGSDFHGLYPSIPL